MIKPKESSHFQFYGPGQVYMFSGVNISPEYSHFSFFLHIMVPICLIFLDF